MQVHGALCDLPGVCDRHKRTLSTSREGGSHPAGPDSEKCCRVKITPWATYLLWKIPAEPGYASGTVIQVVGKECPMVVVPRSRASLQQVQGVAHLLPAADSLQPPAPSDAGVRCLCIWHWSRTRSQVTRRIGKADWLRFSHIECSRAQLFPVGKRCVFGVKRFYLYLFGHHFTLVTDHKPLLGLLGEHKPTSPQASTRVQGWSLYLSMFEYTLAFRNTTAHANADALSRLPLPVEPAIVKQPPELVLLADHLANSPVTVDQICLATRKDPQLSLIVQFLQQGWPSSSAEHFSFLISDTSYRCTKGVYCGTQELSFPLCVEKLC